MGVNSLNKGKGYERRIVKRLSDAFRIKFNRVPNSGAMQSAQGVTDHKFKGDIFTDDDYWNKTHHAIIECKKTGTKITLCDLMRLNNKDPCQLTTWAQQCVKEVEDSDYNFWLIFSYNNSPDFIIIGSNLGDSIVISDPKLLDDYINEFKKKGEEI